MGELAQRGDASIVSEGFYQEVSSILSAARNKAYAAVNFAMVEAYWEIGRSIVEQQGGEDRAEYGEALISGLSFPKGSLSILAKALIRPTFAICGCSTRRFQFVTHCVTN